MSAIKSYVVPHPNIIYSISAHTSSRRPINHPPSPLPFHLIPLPIIAIKLLIRLTKRLPPLQLAFSTPPHIFTTFRRSKFLPFSPLIPQSLLLPVPGHYSRFFLRSGKRPRAHAKPEIVPIFRTGAYVTVTVEIVELPAKAVAVEGRVEGGAAGHLAGEELLGEGHVFG